MHVNESRVTSCLQNTSLWIMALYGLVYMCACVCPCSCACTHMCNMPAFVRGGFQACTQTLVRRGMKMRVYVLRSCCPHAHPRLRAASILLTCASPNRDIRPQPQEGSQHHNIASQHQSKYYHVFWLYGATRTHHVWISVKRQRSLTCVHNEC